MITLTENEKQKICEEYKTSTIENLAREYKISNNRVKTILKENGIVLKNPFASVNEMSYENFAAKRFPPVEGYHYIAKCKEDGSIFTDYLNKGGVLSNHLKKIYGMIIPTTYLRMQYMRTHNELWHEQWFDIVLEKDQVVPTKKCPYCNWETVDIENKSGMFLTHILKEHGITKEEHLKNHPEDREYLSLANKTLDRQFETDSKKYVTCAICGKKLARIDWRHLRKHHITQEEYMQHYTGETISVELHKRLSKITSEMNKTFIPVFESRAEKELKEMLKDAYNNGYQDGKDSQPIVCPTYPTQPLVPPTSPTTPLPYPYDTRPYWIDKVYCTETNTASSGNLRDVRVEEKVQNGNK